MRQQNTKKKEAKTRTKYRKNCTSRKHKKQYGGFLNRYDFAYAGRGTINEAAKVAPGVIKAAKNDINSIAEQRINQIISQGGREIERVLPKILREATAG